MEPEADFVIVVTLLSATLFTRIVDALGAVPLPAFFGRVSVLTAGGSLELEGLDASRLEIPRSRGPRTVKVVPDVEAVLVADGTSVLLFLREGLSEETDAGLLPADLKGDVALLAGGVG